MHNFYHHETIGAVLREVIGGLNLPREVVYYDFPVYENVGDHLIFKGAQALLLEIGVKVTHFKSIHHVKRRSRWTDRGTIICSGGGSFGDIYPVLQQRRLEVIRRHPRARIVVFPCSIHYRSTARAAEDVALMKKHGAVTILVRDQASFEFLHSLGFGSVLLSPDNAHALDGTFPRTAANGNQALLLSRRDGESGGASPVRNQTQRDWEDIVGAGKGRQARLLSAAFAADRLGLVNPLLIQAWRSYSSSLVDPSIRFFNGFTSITTDRLHGMILAHVLGIDCRFFDNANRKLSNYYTTWSRFMPKTRPMEVACTA